MDRCQPRPVCGDGGRHLGIRRDAVRRGAVGRAIGGRTRVRRVCRRALAGRHTDGVRRHLWHQEPNDRPARRIRRLAGTEPGPDRLARPAQAQRERARLRSQSPGSGGASGRPGRPRSHPGGRRPRGRSAHYGCPAEEIGAGKAFMVKAGSVSRRRPQPHLAPGHAQRRGRFERPRALDGAFQLSRPVGACRLRSL